MIEVVGALAIVGLLWAGAAYVLPQVAKYVEAHSERGHHLRELEAMEALFGRDIRTMARVDGGRGRIQGTQIGATWYAVTMNGIRSITYRLEPLDRNLVREERSVGIFGDSSERNADAGMASRDIRTTVVARGVSRVDFSYFDAEARSWSNLWDGERRRKLPDAVALDIVFEPHQTPHRTVSSPRSTGEILW